VTRIVRQAAWNDNAYSVQIVRHEVSSINQGESLMSVYAPVEYTPILPDTMVGTIFRGETPIQIFAERYGVFRFSCLGNQITQVIDGRLDNITGKIFLQWNKPPGTNHVVVSYKWAMQIAVTQSRQRCDVLWHKYGF
jgi:hypothetical protein